jgi:diguanylate cyclase (GGDEF)-like protein/PAS domain S-box-containing protein
MLGAVLGAAPVGLGVLDRELRLTHVNEPLARALGHPAEDALGCRPSQLGEETESPLEDVAREVLVRGRAGFGLQLVRESASGPRHWSVSAHPLEDDGSVQGVLLVAEEITDRRRLEQLAATDPLTGLANRRAFHDRLGAEVERAHRHARDLSVALIDLDGFKGINDTFGHEAGDRVLVDVAAFLRGSVRSTDLLARVGGDEFAILMPETDAAAARALAERAHALVGGAALGDGYHVSLSIGLSDLTRRAPRTDAAGGGPGPVRREGRGARCGTGPRAGGRAPVAGA